MKLEHAPLEMLLSIMEPEYLNSPYWQEYLIKLEWPNNTIVGVIKYMVENGWYLDGRPKEEIEEFLTLLKKYVNISFEFKKSGWFHIINET